MLYSRRSEAQRETLLQLLKPIQNTVLGAEFQEIVIIKLIVILLQILVSTAFSIANCDRPLYIIAKIHEDLKYLSTIQLNNLDILSVE